MDDVDRGEWCGAPGYWTRWNTVEFCFGWDDPNGDDDRYDDLAAEVNEIVRRAYDD